MFKSRLNVLLGATFLIFMLGMPAYGDTIINLSGSGASCGNSPRGCFGNVLTLTIHPAGGFNYVVTLTINTSGNTNPGSGIAAVAFRFGFVTSATLTSFNGGSPAGWSTINKGLGANGCGNGSGHFGCSANATFIAGTAAALAPVATGGGTGVYTWVWNVRSEDWDGLPAGVYVGVDFGNVVTVIPGSEGGQSRPNGLIAATTVAPEPGALLLFGTGLACLAEIVRRRRST